jgi:hypothetical protein
MDRLVMGSTSQALYFARSMAMGIVECGWRGRSGEKRGSEGGRRRREGVRLPSSARCRLCRLCHGVTLQTMQFTWPCQKMACPVPALPKMPPDTYRKPYVAQVRIPIPIGLASHSSIQVSTYSTVLPSPSLKATTVLRSSKPTPTLSGSSAPSIHQICLPLRVLQRLAQREMTCIPRPRSRHCACLPKCLSTRGF